MHALKGCLVLWRQLRKCGKQRATKHCLRLNDARSLLTLCPARRHHACYHRCCILYSVVCHLACYLVTRSHLIIRWLNVLLRDFRCWILKQGWQPEWGFPARHENVHHHAS
jgi:hypothetical protein